VSYRTGVLAVLILAAACGGSRPPMQSGTLLPSASDDRALEVVTAALESDARLDPADSLYDREALVVANGEMRYAPPRYAAVRDSGAMAIASSRVEVRSGVAWAQVEYRWISTAKGLARDGRATFVLTPDDKGAWRIRHAHSSSSEPAP
jgi:hypothetical protein